MWVQIVETWLTARLLSSPTFHRAVGQVAKRVREIRHGRDPSELGGMNIDEPPRKGFFHHFAEEVKEQFRGGPPKK